MTEKEREKQHITEKEAIYLGGSWIHKSNDKVVKSKHLDTVIYGLGVSGNKLITVYRQYIMV